MADSNHNRRSSGMDRRAAARSSMRLSFENNDDYDLAAMGISDGFRPTANASVVQNGMSAQSSHRERRSTPPPRPSSLTKPRNLDTFALRHDGVNGASSRPSVVPLNADSITRSSSVSTDVPFMRPESPYQGPGGPSHPYHMYPQNTRLARTASMATTSTVLAPSERQYSGPSGPAHPYGMYPQNTVPESEAIDARAPLSDIPVGFPGHRGDYQRRIGPDGDEVGDIIGPLGHTEQLPPYTKYPDEAFSRKTVPGLPDLQGAGGIGLATRNPEFASREDLNSPLSHQSNLSLTSDHENQRNTVPLPESEKPPEPRWKTYAKKRLCGIIPIWLLVLLAIVIFVFTLILGIAVGIIMHHRNSTSPYSSPKSYPTVPGTIYATVTTTYDAVSLSAAPTGIPTLPTGTFLLPIATPVVSMDTCLDNSAMYGAWSCLIPLSSIRMTISPILGISSKTSCNKITLGQVSVPSTYFYGTQPPVIATEQVLSLVNDTQHNQYGPAWYFEVAYDKLIIAPENTFPSASNDKRDQSSDGWEHKATAQTGDHPWFCHWNGTILETFIYVNRSNIAVVHGRAATPWTTAGPWGSYPSSWSSSMLLSDSSKTSNTVPLDFSKTSITATLPTSSPAPNLLAYYPKLIKVEERRKPYDAASVPPYCVQMTINGDGTAVPILDEHKRPITIYLNETEPALPRTLKRSAQDRDSSPALSLTERQTSQSCHCEWLTS